MQQLGGLDLLVKCLQLKSLLAVRFALWTLATCAGDGMKRIRGERKEGRE